jgi:hypothetical protein
MPLAEVEVKIVQGLAREASPIFFPVPRSLLALA